MRLQLRPVSHIPVTPTILTSLRGIGRKAGPSLGPYQTLTLPNTYEQLQSDAREATGIAGAH